MTTTAAPRASFADSPLRVNAARVGLIVACLVGWELLTRLRILDNPAFVPASDIVRALWDVLWTKVLWTALGDTLTSWLVGLVLCVAIGVPLGVLFGWRASVYRSVRFLVEFFRSTPPVVLIPFVLLFFGPTQEMKIVLVVAGAVWPILIQTMYGVHDVDGTLLQTSKAYRIGGWRFVAQVLMPSVSPYVITGARVTAVLALLLAIGSEMVTSAPGLGREILMAQSGGSMGLMYALIVIAGLLGMALNFAFSKLERKVLAWHPSQRPDAH